MDQSNLKDNYGINNNSTAKFKKISSVFHTESLLKVLLRKDDKIYLRTNFIDTAFGSAAKNVRNYLKNLRILKLLKKPMLLSSKYIRCNAENFHAPRKKIR